MASADTLGNAPAMALLARLSTRSPGSAASRPRSGAAPDKPSRSSCSPCTLPFPWHDTPNHCDALPRHGTAGVPHARSGPGGAPSGPRSVSRNAISTSPSGPAPPPPASPPAAAAAEAGPQRHQATRAAAAATAMRPGGRGRAMALRLGSAGRGGGRRR
ncbi:Os02g0174450 [Oryza sativa Japonica Group]|uniref:Os02g0174450 protein n=1 Tax=Oryza sativa subsp. japonica TaxID=39947 RepID=A0A0P0VFH7_ORYSJ|nr:Os02g0174450 [Oryza sativa Japonica Group]